MSRHKIGLIGNFICILSLNFGHFLLARSPTFFRSVECFRVVKVFAKPGWSVLRALCVVLERDWTDLSN